MQKPFIYICSLRRTGSTVVAESLTALPHSFVFREPLLGEGLFKLKPEDAELFRARGVDLGSFAEGWRPGLFGRSRVRAFKNEVLPRLAGVCRQIGVKEIRNAGWKEYVRHFPDLRVVLTGRDPRDIYISLHGRVQAGKSAWKGPFEPRTVAKRLLQEFEHQLAVDAATECLRVRYEDFCTDPAVYARMKEFTEVDIPEMGAIGALNAANPNRSAEVGIHGDELTAKRTERWRTVTDETLRGEAFRTFELMPGYREFWGYTE